MVAVILEGQPANGGKELCRSMVIVQVRQTPADTNFGGTLA
jgi:hypothetical protein